MNILKIYILGLNVNIHTLILETYHLTRIKIYESWALKMKNILMKNNLYNFWISTQNLSMSKIKKCDK